ncbi:DHH family phosphoesterase [Cytobacillus sp. IB215665]|uniref:DHH family phosphoesterase n=1 Tax=Cytobacillus sp. IB215665 TaxID=3097357 RepID=UPI002A134135|nr:DHH family phosphoesterase [Cytobacillus sp. IB215665]MDX8363560.1 DHH family phosphoesterase [Cytobacillus sp. IB215665]
MPSYYKKSVIRYPIYGIISISILMILIITFYQWIYGIIAFVLLVIPIYFFIKSEKVINQSIEDYISTLSHRVKKVGEEALLEMPIGILLYNEHFNVEWSNSFLTSYFPEDTLVGRSLHDITESLIPIIKQEVDDDIITLYERKVKVHVKPEERLIYFFDVTEQKEIQIQYENERTVLAVILLDNYDEVTQGVEDQTRSNLNSQVTFLLNKWAKENGVFIKRTSSERFIAVLNEYILKQLETESFSILDDVREKTSKHHLPLTLSIGIGVGVSSLPELGVLAQSSLDLALGRGGDQVAIKQTNGKVKFYGGKTNPMEKRTRVRARVISHALKELVTESDQVLIMGHVNPDMDSIGSAIGILKVAEVNEKNGYIVIDKDDIGTGIERLINEIKKDTNLWSRFITPEQALEIITDETLLVVVDTHKSSLVIEERLLNKTESVVVIDHHRRGEDFIEDPLLVYMEPYASSTAELVTELLAYQPKGLKMDMLEATSLLAGIIVDTKSFTLRTGSRTFDAASNLRAHGADTILVQKLLKENIDHYVKRANLISKAVIYRSGLTIALGDADETYDQVLLAQAADTLLSMNDVTASFVVAMRSDHVIGISARSLGNVNVQVIMEALGGGGHLTNAATQLENITIDEAKQKLKLVLDDYLDGGKES